MRLRMILMILAGYASIILFAVAPLLSVLLAIAIASACGAELNEGGYHPCIVAGVDIGNLLGFMFVMGWLAILTIPLGLLGVVVFTVVVLSLLIHRGIKRFRSRHEGYPILAEDASALDSDKRTSHADSREAEPSADHPGH